MQQFQALLRERTVGRGALTQLAAQAGLATSVVSRWRDGIARPSPENLEQLAPALGVPYEELLRMCGYLPGAAAATAPPDPDLAAIQAAWRHLSPERKEIIRTLAVIPGGGGHRSPTRRQSDKPKARRFVSDNAPNFGALDGTPHPPHNITAIVRRRALSQSRLLAKTG